MDNKKPVETKSAGKKPVERRSDFRAPAVYPLWYRPVPLEGKNERDWIMTVTSNISGGGVCFREGERQYVKVKPGDLLELRLSIPAGPVFCIAEAVRVFEDNGDTMVAAKFISMEERDRDRIVRLALSEGLEREHDWR